jgi:nucleoside-diphosphate-sugar epimerase
LRRVLPLPLDGNQFRLSHQFLFCDTSKAQRELGLPEPRPFRQAAQEAYDWYRDRGMIAGRRRGEPPFERPRSPGRG